MKTLIDDNEWHSSPTLNYSVKYEAERPNIYDKTVRVRFKITMRSLYSSCNFNYGLYIKNSINNKEYTVTSKFGTGVKSVSYTTPWIEFESTGKTRSVTFTPRCGDASHTSKDSGTISFPAYVEPAAKITTHKISGVGLTSISVQCATDLSVNLVQYSLDGGSWITVSGLNYTITGLSPNTYYSIRTRVRSSSGGIYTTSTSISATTLDRARISSAENFEHGNDAKVKVTNPANISSLNLVGKINGEQIVSKTVYTGENTIAFSDDELDSIYRKYGTSDTLTMNYTLTGSGYTNSASCTITLKGNQKNGYRNVNGLYKRCKRWRKINGEWKRCVRWRNVEGVWRRCI